MSGELRARLINALEPRLAIRNGTTWTWAAYIADVLLAGVVGDLVAATKSNISIDGERQTWQQLYEREHKARLELQDYRTMLSDLDRNEHGRHEGDIDGAAPSQGNPHLKTGDVLGYSLGAAWKYVVPEPRLRGDLHAWKVLNVDV